MKIGGNGEFWMVVGPLLAIGLAATWLAGSPAEMVTIAERVATDAWAAAATAFRR